MNGTKNSNHETLSVNPPSRSSFNLQKFMTAVQRPPTARQLWLTGTAQGSVLLSSSPNLMHFSHVEKNTAFNERQQEKLDSAAGKQVQPQLQAIDFIQSWVVVGRQWGVLALFIIPQATIPSSVTTISFPLPRRKNLKPDHLHRRVSALSWSWFEGGRCSDYRWICRPSIGKNKESKSDHILISIFASLKLQNFFIIVFGLVWCLITL